MKTNQSHYGLVKFNPIVTAILLTLPAATYAADVSMTNGATSMVNGITVININEANANGISHNIYDKLNTGKEGIVFNNSQNGITTQLAGQIDGNSNLASGSAKVILNEVTSKNKSTLSGMLEVAGDKAHLIVANPNGISCEGCGFINTDKVTITTGTPDMQNGELKGYSVSGGTITANGLTSDSPTQIISRSSVINGSVATSDALTVVAGNNYVNTDGQVTGTVKASILGKPTYGIDVAKLGGMYANKITLISTESGVGVRNRGKLSAGDGGINLDSSGRLLNSAGMLQATGDIAIKTNGTLENAGGTIASNKAISVDTTKNSISNVDAGKITSGSDIAVSSGAFDNTNGKVAGSNSVAIDTNSKTLTNKGKGDNVGINAGAVFVQAGTLDNSGGQIKGYYIGTSSTKLDNSKGIIDSWGDVDIATTSTINNSGGLIRSADGHVKIDSGTSTLNNDNTKSADTSSNDSLGIIAGIGGIQISSGAIKNKGQIVSSGDVTINSSGGIENASGKVHASKTVSIKATRLAVGTGSVVADGDVNIDVTGEVENNIGVLSSQNGTMNIKASTVNNYAGMLLGHNINIEADKEINNSAGLMVADNDLTLKTPGTVYNSHSALFKGYGQYLGVANQEGGMIAKGSADIQANRFDNSSSRLVAEKGTLKLDITKSLANDAGLISSATGTTLTADAISNNFATIHSAGDVTINTGSLSLLSSGSVAKNNATGVINSGNDLTLNVASSFSNFGWITGTNKVALTSTGTLYNNNMIYSPNAVDVYAKTAIDNYDTIAGDRTLTVGTTGKIWNTGDIFSEGKASISARTLYNASFSSVVGGREGLELDVNTRLGFGQIVGL